MSSTNLVRPSRDGDQFHYLWAARRCLRLIDSHTGLHAISIEGSSPGERSATSVALAGEELIDIAEYYGDEDVSRAQLVRYLQLKHSTLRAHESWTASGLEKTLTGFAARYRHLSARFTADVLTRRFEFWFVTNRPISTDFIEAISDAASGATSRHPAELKKLERFTGFSGVELSAFCRLIRFEERQDGYWDQRNILFQDVGGYLPDSDVDAPTQLKELVTRKALSEFESNPVITKVDVLRALKTDEGRLYPAPCRIEALDRAVVREQEAVLIRAIVHAQKQPVFVHADGGVGKSMFATRIGASLPNGSVSVLYDCFGNGQYRSATGYRHRHQEALVQIANELAAKGLCHPLIPTVHADGPAYLRAFSYRLQQAVSLMRLAHSDAVLCIVIDAADNAQMAAEEVGQSRSFIRDLLRETLPEGVRLVALCRSHRQGELDPPTGTLRLELNAFSRAETASHLRTVFQDASEQDVDEFHRLSSHNPRVQALALSRGLSLPDTLRLLGPNPTTVESAIGGLLDDAIEKLRDGGGPIEKGRIEKICIGLAALRPLIPISVLSRMSGVSEGAIRSFALDLGRPLLVAGDTVQFLDEPSETWFRDRFKPSRDEMAAFTRSLAPLAEKSAYVASTLPQLMLEAGQFSELVALALNSTALPETSPVEKRDVELQRLQFALKASLRLKRYPDASKLALKAGGETAGEDRQRALIQSNTDLAAKFIDSEVIQDIVSRRVFGSGWLGSHHAYEAGLLSGRSELTGDARSKLRMAFEWLGSWSRLSPEEREKEPVSDSDVAELSLAELNIHGPVAAARGIAKWKPRDVSFRVGCIVASRLIDDGRFDDLDDLAVAAGNNICLVLAIIFELRLVQKTPSQYVVRRTLRLVSNSRLTLKRSGAWDTSETVLDAITALIEAALTLSVCPFVDAAALLKRYLPSTPSRGLSSRYGGTRGLLLRAYCLEAALSGRSLQLVDLAYPELKIELEKERIYQVSRDAQDFQSDIGTLLPWHQLFASVTVGAIAKEDLSERIAGACDASIKAAGRYYQDESHVLNEVASIWFSIVCHTGTVSAETLGVLMSWIGALKRPLFTSTLTSMARLGAHKDDTKAIALEFAATSFALTRDERVDAASKSDAYLDVARAVLCISATEAKAYFNEALTVASKTGNENLSRWDAILRLAERSAQEDRQYPEIAYRFARCAELTWDYVARDKHFPWRSTVKALSALCPSSVFAILSRWRDRGFGSAGRILPIATHHLIELGSVDPRDALPLVGFDAKWDYPKLLRDVLDKSAERAEKEAAIKLLLRYVKWQGQTSSDWRRMRDAAARYGIALPDVESYITSTECEERLVLEREAAQRGAREAETGRSEHDWNQVFVGNELTTADDIAKAHATFKNTPAPWNHEDFFAEAFRRVVVGGEAAFIEAVGIVPEFDLYDFRKFLEIVPDAWKARPSVKQSLEVTLKAFCRRFCMSIARHRYFEALPFELACQVTGVREADMADVVLDALGESLDLLDSDRLFSLVSLLVLRLSHGEALESLAFGLDFFDEELEEKDGDGTWSDRLAPPTSVQASIAGYVYAGLAAPPARVRWDAAHAVLGLCALGRAEVIRHLVGLAQSNSGGPFVDANLPFYKLHALQWLLISFARAASEFPSALDPVATYILNLAQNDQPHVMIRLFAARAALALIEKGRLANENGLVARLLRVNTTSLPYVESGPYDRLSCESEDADEDYDGDKFYFGIDIGPSWYAPLGRVFALRQGKIESEARSLIRNEFGCSAKGAWDEDERERRKLFTHEDTYARDSSYPRTDTHNFYLAYHAMMIVAGRLLATRPTYRNTEWGEQDEFVDWMSRHDLTRSDGRWLADRRDPRPLERPTWRNVKKDAPDYATVTQTDFEQALWSGDGLNVWGYWLTTNTAREQSVSVRSALVSSDKAMALLRALGTTKDENDYLIPSANAEAQINRPGFALEGWVEDRSSDGGIDRADQWSGGVHFPPPLPASRIVDLLSIKTDLDSREWRDAEAEIVMLSQMWGHFEERDGDNNPERGERLQASMGFIKRMLSNVKRDLIVQVQIERRKLYQRYESRQDDEQTAATKLYLIKNDGSIASF